MKKRFIKPIIGVLLMVMAIGGLFYWEGYGREEWTMTDVLVTNVDILEGTEISKDLFKTQKVPKESLIKEAITKELPLWAVGRKSAHFIPQNSQINSSFFSKERYVLEKGKTLFLIKPDWIDSVSSTLRGDDTVNLYSENGDVYLGTYRVAFVKGEGSQEIYDSEILKASDKILERDSGTGVVTHFEIVATLGDYAKILNFIEMTSRRILVVQSHDGEGANTLE